MKRCSQVLLVPEEQLLPHCHAAFLFRNYREMKHIGTDLWKNWLRLWQDIAEEGSKSLMQLLFLEYPACQNEREFIVTYV